MIDSGATVSYPAGAAADSSTISVPVVNSGTLGVTTGTLTLNDSSGALNTNNGSLTVGSGATMALETPFKFTTGSSQSGAGTLQIGGGTTTTTTTLSASLSLGNVDDRSTLAAASGTASTVTGFDLDGGTLDGPGTITDSRVTGSSAAAAAPGSLSAGADLIANGAGPVDRRVPVLRRWVEARRSVVR